MTDQAVPVLAAVADTDDDVRAAVEPPTPASPGPTFVFSARVRRATVAYVAVTVPLLGALFWAAREPHHYLQAMSAISLFYVVPGLVAAVVAAVRSPASDRLVRWAWAALFIWGTLLMIATRDRIYPDMNPPVMRVSVPIIITLVLLVVANTLILRSRSGHRAALVDGVDLVMATAALTVPLLLAVGQTIADSPVPWFATSSGLWFVVACHGTLVAAVIQARVDPGHRTMANLGVLFGLATMASAAAHVVLAVDGFTHPAGLFLMLFALASGIGLLFFVHATRTASPGLERLALSDQVRRHSLIAVLVMTAVPVIGMTAWWQQDQRWVPMTGLVAVLALLVLSSIRHLLAARESARLHALVEESARRRGELLAEVMAHVDTDRHRAAAHLHRQAASLYATMASFTAALDQATASGDASSVAFAAERMRRDLAARADRLRRVAEAVKPLTPPDHEGSRRLAAPMRAYLANVCGDGPGPELEIDVDPGLVLDWTTEAAVLRLVQEATVSAWWYGGAEHVAVAVSAEGCDVSVEILDDGDHATPPNLVVSSLQSVARFLGGDITVERDDQGGRVSARLPVGGAVPEDQRVHLRLVRDGTTAR